MYILWKKGEEIFEDYAYDMNYDDTPRWYREEHEKFYGVLDKSWSHLLKISGRNSWRILLSSAHVHYVLFARDLLFNHG